MFLVFHTNVEHNDELASAKEQALKEINEAKAVSVQMQQQESDLRVGNMVETSCSYDCFGGRKHPKWPTQSLQTKFDLVVGLFFFSWEELA